MSIYVGGSELFAPYVGGQMCEWVYSGSNVIWERPNVWGLRTTSSNSGTGNSYNQVTSLNLNGDYPRTVGDSNRLHVPAHCPSSFQVTVSARGSYSGGMLPSTNLRIIHNGSNVATSGNNDLNVSATRTVSPGDWFSLQFRGEGQLFNRPSLNSGATLTVTPIGY